MREGFNVDSVLIEDGTVVGITGHTEDGERVEATARIVIGADGKNSHVAKAVRAAEYETRPRLQYSYYTYFRDLPTDGMEIYIRPDRGFAAAPTNDGLTMVVVGWPYAEAAAYKADVEANYLKTLELAPEFADAGAGRDTHGALPRRRGSRLLPYAVRPWLGAGR